MVQISSTRPDLYFLKIMEFSHYNEYGVIIGFDVNIISELVFTIILYLFLLFLLVIFFINSQLSLLP